MNIGLKMGKLGVNGLTGIQIGYQSYRWMIEE